MDKRTSDKIVELYERGLVVAEIERRAGVSKPTIYRVLKAERVDPSRHRKASPMLERLIELERENAVLRERLGIGRDEKI